MRLQCSLLESDVESHSLSPRQRINQLTDRGSCFFFYFNIALSSLPNNDLVPGDVARPNCGVCSSPLKGLTFCLFRSLLLNPVGVAIFYLNSNFRWEPARMPVRVRARAGGRQEFKCPTLVTTKTVAANTNIVDRRETYAARPADAAELMLVASQHSSFNLVGKFQSRFMEPPLIPQYLACNPRRAGPSVEALYGLVFFGMLCN
ncbi:hypothetical protein EVAR_64071_1 [Eumeta japonica]|uniref:Uncharacterized protein n=1 Tax=Eumeta variegata TaxID=151549 RepID=A0A4C1Z9F6_EUMVA|nr:hypothetical protein EVAR_64071_1 [Eumeta japonica]